MPETPQPDPGSLSGDVAVADPADRQKKKKKDKVRSAWISFAGRVVAQVVGAVATIVLTVYFVQRSQSTPENGQRASDPPPSAVTRTRRAGSEPTLAVLPLRNFSGDPQQDYFADGMTEAIIADLARVSGLRVMSSPERLRWLTRNVALRADRSRFDSLRKDQRFVTLMRR